jgi:DNA-binding transcriptional LysR family regulator
MTILDVESVQAFVAIADFQSFTRAAEALGTTQGAISVKLKRLEDRIGQRLIERTPRSVRLSAQGALFLDGARGFLAAHERAVAGLIGLPPPLYTRHRRPRGRAGGADAAGAAQRA